MFPIIIDGRLTKYMNARFRLTLDIKSNSDVSENDPRNVERFVLGAT